MHRRGVGIAAAHKKQAAQNKFQSKGIEIAANDFEAMSRQMEMFRTNLEEFASKYKSDIRRNPEFRQQFQEMCAAIGVDPLASGKGFWAEMLGVGDFYYELGVQIVEVCLATRSQNGGLMTIEDLRERLIRSRSKTRKEDISIDDLLRAIKTLKTLGNGFSVIPVGKSHMVQSVPGELNMDHTTVLDLATRNNGFVTAAVIKEALRWDTMRMERVLDFMVKEGLAWVDDQTGGDRAYYFPGMCQGSAASPPPPPPAVS